MVWHRIQAIIWNNADLNHERLHEAPGGDELKSEFDSGKYIQLICYKSSR